MKKDGFLSFHLRLSLVQFIIIKDSLHGLPRRRRMHGTHLLHSPFFHTHSDETFRRFCPSELVKVGLSFQENSSLHRGFKTQFPMTTSAYYHRSSQGGAVHARFVFEKHAFLARFETTSVSYLSFPSQCGLLLFPLSGRPLLCMMPMRYVAI